MIVLNSGSICNSCSASPTSPGPLMAMVPLPLADRVLETPRCHLTAIFSALTLCRPLNLSHSGKDACSPASGSPSTRGASGTSSRAAGRVAALRAARHLCVLLHLLAAARCFPPRVRRRAVWGALEAEDNVCVCPSAERSAIAHGRARGQSRGAVATFIATSGKLPRARCDQRDPTRPAPAELCISSVASAVLTMWSSGRSLRNSADPDLHYPVGRSEMSLIPV
jgi:hypothetical protein